jgi:hypothetical protein
VRLVLDTFFPEAFALRTDATSEMLDAMVAVWLGVARSLAESGVRVTLVGAASDRMGGVAPKRLELAPRTPSLALRLGAQIAWQGEVPVDKLLTDEATFVVSCAVLTSPPVDPKIRWIIVSKHAPEPTWPLPSSALMAYPPGHPENRFSQRRRIVREFLHERQDHVRAMRVMQTSVAPPPPGSFAAMPLGGSIRLEALS